MYPLAKFVPYCSGCNNQEADRKKSGNTVGLQKRLEEFDFAEDSCMMSQRFNDIGRRLERL